MKKIFLFIAAFLALQIATPVSADQELPNHPLIELTHQKQAQQLAFAMEHHAQFGLTPDHKSFYLLWFPEGSDPKNPPPIVVTLSGHDGWAVQDFRIWHPFLKDRGYGLLTLQWWLGSGETTRDYLTPSEMYRAIDTVLQEAHVKPGAALLHGFSRGSTNTYAVTALDTSTHRNYFALIIANAGRASSNYPPTHEIEMGEFGDKPLTGTHWVTYAGGKDTNPNRDGIPAMRETGDWIRQYGGHIELAIEDPDSGHGGFHMKPENCRAALDIFENLRVKT